MSAAAPPPWSENGFKFDTGPTFFLYPRVLREIFAAAGRDLDEEIPMYRLDPQYRLVFGSGGELLATPDLERMERAIAQLSPEDARGFHRFFCDNRNKLEKFTPFLESPFESWRDLAKLDMLKLLPLLRPWRSLDSDLRSYFKDERIRLGFSFQSKYLGMSPFTCPSLFSILSFLEYEHGVFHPVGGCGAVTKAMARIAEDLGARVLLNEPVEEMIFAGRKCTAVRTASRTLAADAVVVNADFAQAMQRMVPDSIRRRWTDSRIEKKRFSCSTFMLYLGIEGRYDEVSHHTIYLAEDYRQNLRDIEATAPALGRSFVLCAECLRHRSVAGAEEDEHALRSAAGDARASQCRLGGGTGALSRAGPAPAGEDRHQGRGAPHPL